MAVTIRQVTENDARLLKVVRLAALAEAPYAFGSTHEREAAMSDDEWSERARSSAARVDRVTFFAEDGADVVGLVTGLRTDDPIDGVEVVSMWIDPQHRRRGLGRSLVDEVVGWAAAHRATSISLWVTRGNEPAAQLYRALGFTATDEFQPLPSDPCRDEVRMTRRLGDRG